jgi:2-(3-amino-3-carboxypropyl)histidine synthase
MQVVHVPAKLNADIDLPDEYLDSLPDTVAVFTTIQLIDNLESFVEQIEASGTETKVLKTGHTRNEGQVLGCNVQPWQEYSEVDFDDFAYIGDGMFHPRALLWKNENKNVYGHNPFNETNYVIDDEEIGDIRQKYHAAVSTFHMEDQIGVLVTTKPGQMMLQRAFDLEDEYPDKEFYYFIDNTIDFSMLDDFNFVDCWVNTACPRISFEDSIKMEAPIVNLEDVKKENPRRALIR